MYHHVLPRMACGCAIFVFALAHCGCQSMKSPAWGTAWKSNPTRKTPADREVVTYLGQKKKEPKPDPEELKSRMARAHESSPQPSFETHLRQGNQALRENRLAEARLEYEQGLKLRPNDVDCHHRLAVVADKERQFGLADDHYEAALKQRPRDPNLLSDLGYSYSLRGDDAQAEKTLKQALSVSPSHKGAMGNLGMIYARQGRYEDALAMFRRGASEAEAQQYVAQLFPQRGPADSQTELAQNTNPQRTAPQTADERPDTRFMTPEQLKEAMNRERNQALQRRQEQLTAEAQPRRDWASDPPAQQPRQPQQDFAQQSSPITLGPGAGQSQFQPMPQGNPMNQGFAANAPYHDGQTVNVRPGAAPNNSQFAPQDGSLAAQPAANSNSDIWNGAGTREIQPVGGFQSSPNSRLPEGTNAQYQSQSGFPGAFDGQNRSPSGAAGQQPGFPQGQQAAEANLAAAQLGMNVGPGGLFPVVHTDAAAQPGFGPPGFGVPAQVQAPAAIDNRFGGEFSAPPQYQNPGFPPNRSSFNPGEPRQGAGGPQAGPFGDAKPTDSLGPASPANDWPVIQSGSASSTQNRAVPQFNDPVNRPAAGQTSSWADKPNLGSAPFNGSWPPGSQSAIPANPNSNPNPNAIPYANPSNPYASANPANASTQNSVRGGNGTQADNRSQPAAFDTGILIQPAQWPHTPQ